MAKRTDPENNETRALLDMVDFGGQQVLEVGCGDGSKTIRYAEKAAHVTAIDPDSQQITLAKKNLPGELRGRIEFHNIAFEDFATTCTPSAFDIVILTSSLC